MKTPYKNCPECGANLDPCEVCECKKKTASSGDTLKAEQAVNAKDIIIDIFPQNQDRVKHGFEEAAFFESLGIVHPGRLDMVECL